MEQAKPGLAACERHLGVTVDHKLNVSWQCAIAAKRTNEILDGVSGAISSKSQEVVVFLHTTLVSPHLLCPVLGTTL